MPIKNYTSQVDASRSLELIERTLVKAGATHVSRWYVKGEIAGVLFSIQVDENTLQFKMPAKIDNVFNALWAEVLRPVSGSKERTLEQAKRTTWKILLDWVQAQMALIEMDQVKAQEVFMPYLYDARSDKTLFEYWEGHAYKGLLGDGKK